LLSVPFAVYRPHALVTTDRTTEVHVTSRLPSAHRPAEAGVLVTQDCGLCCATVALGGPGRHRREIILVTGLDARRHLIAEVDHEVGEMVRRQRGDHKRDLCRPAAVRVTQENAGVVDDVDVDT